jgi:hypothetical protein
MGKAASRTLDILSKFSIDKPSLRAEEPAQAALVIAGVISEEKPMVAVLKKSLLQATREISKQLEHLPLPRAEYSQRLRMHLSAIHVPCHWPG